MTQSNATAYFVRYAEYGASPGPWAKAPRPYSLAPEWVSLDRHLAWESFEAARLEAFKRRLLGEPAFVFCSTYPPSQVNVVWPVEVNGVGWDTPSKEIERRAQSR